MARVTQADLYQVSPPGSGTGLCGACGASGGLESLFRKWDVDIVECSRCGSAQAIVPHDFDPSAIYSEDYYQGGRADGYGDYAASEPVIRREFRSSLGVLRNSGCHGGKLLELGCAYGFFMKEAAAYFQCTGIEVSEAARIRATAAGEKVFPDLTDPAVRSRGPYDAVVLIDCIEHLVDPFQTIRDATTMTTDHASIVVVTGDWSSTFARRTRDRWRLMTPPQHLFFFSRDGITKLLARCGYEVVAWDRPWRRVSAGLAAYQLTRRLGLAVPVPPRLNRFGLPMKLFDGMRVVARRVDTVTHR